MSFISRVELKYQLQSMGIKVENGYIKRSDLEKVFAKYTVLGNSTVYHHTSLTIITLILKENKFIFKDLHEESNYYHSDDNDCNRDTIKKELKSYPEYFFSTTRNKSSRYSEDVDPTGFAVTLNLDQNALKHNLKSTPFVRFHGEMEERFWSNKAEVKPATKYIKEIHVDREGLKKEVELLDENPKTQANECKSLVGLAKKYNIPVYWYDKTVDFYNQKNAKKLN